MDPVERDTIAQHARPDQRAHRFGQEGAAVRHQKDDAAARVFTLIELTDRLEQRAAHIRVGETGSGRARLIPACTTSSCCVNGTTLIGRVLKNMIEKRSSGRCATNSRAGCAPHGLSAGLDSDVPAG